MSTNAPFEPITSASGAFVGLQPGSGDYNADGDDFDFPDVANYSHGSSRQAFLHGIFSAGQFPQPAFGQEGNEKYDRFVGPNYDDWDAALLKDTKIAENLHFKFRFEVFNIANRANLTSFDSNLPDATFGQATAQLPPRFIQFGGNLIF